MCIPGLICLAALATDGPPPGMLTSRNQHIRTSLTDPLQASDAVDRLANHDEPWHVRQHEGDGLPQFRTVVTHEHGAHGGGAQLVGFHYDPAIRDAGSAASDSTARPPSGF